MKDSLFSEYTGVVLSPLTLKCFSQNSINMTSTICVFAEERTEVDKVCMENVE